MSVILSAAKNLNHCAEILRSAQNDEWHLTEFYPHAPSAGSQHAKNTREKNVLAQIQPVAV
jgi:hypothetical protein